MKIGVFVSVVAGQKGFESNVSGHIQVPLKSIDELRAKGHDVHLITNEFSEDRSLPFCLANDLEIHFVTDSRNRGGVLERTGKPGQGFSLKRLLRQVSEIKRICKEQQFDVLHLYGYNRTAHLAGGLRLLGLKTPVAVTIFGTFFPERLSFLTKRLWKRIDAVITATAFVKNNFENEGIPTTKITHGVIRQIIEEYEGPGLGAPHRVLFWRDLTVDNGADVVIETYEKLAPKYPEINFDFAVRQHWEPIKGIDKIAENHKNIHIYHFPYEEGITLPKLLLESICVVMPIRKMSIDPQLVIAETLAAGIPVIASNQRSNPEFIVEGKTGALVPLGDVEATTAALDRILSNLDNAAEMGRAAKEDIATRWNWDNYAKDLVEVYEKVIH